MEHLSIKNLFAKVAKWRVTEVMCQAREFDNVRLNAKLLPGLQEIVIELDGDRLGDLCNFQRMGQPIPKEIGFVSREELRLALEAPKGG